MKATSLVKIAGNLSDNQHKENAEKIFTHKFDGIEVSHFGGRWGDTWETSKNYNLDFLKFYKGIKVLRFYLTGVTDLAPILVLTDELENLQLGEFDLKKISLTPLGQLKNLSYLSVVRNQNGLESITQLPKLSELALTGHSLEKLPFLNDLTELKQLYIGFGTSKNFDNIHSLSKLEELDVLWVKQLSDIQAISKLTNLVKIRMEDEKQITALPDLSKLTKLKNIRLMNFGSLENVSTLVNSNVEEFILTGSNKNVDFLKSLTNAEKLQKVYTFFYTKREQDKAEKILGDKFCDKDKMNFDMLNRTPILYHDIETGQRKI
jgi:Leucine-rich repeat (LRR) protein